MLSIINKFANYIFSNHSAVAENAPRINPLNNGEYFPNFLLSKEKGLWNATSSLKLSAQSTSARQLLNKPLVIAFYSVHWNQYGIDLLKNLNAIQNEINLMGGNLLVITSEEIKYLLKDIKAHNLSLNLYYDANHEIAEKFGLFKEDDPIWNRISGVDINVPLLSTYVISPNKTVVYNHIDTDFDNNFSSKEILTAVFDASRYNRS